MAVAWDATGAGNNSAGTAISWTHTVASATPATYVLVGVEISVSSNSTATTCTATYGGVSMTLLSGALTLLGSSTNRSAVGIFYLANPASGAQTVTVTPGGASTKARCAANSVSYTRVGSIGSQQSAASLTLSAASVSGGYDFAVSVNGATISAPTQTQRYLNTASVSGVGDSILIQDAAGTGSSISFSSSGTATTPTTLGVALSPTTPMSTLTDNFATKDTTKWAWGGTAGVSGGQAVQTPTLANDQWIIANQSYDLTGVAFSAELVQTPNVGNGGTTTYILLDTGIANTYFYFQWLASGNLVMGELNAGADDSTSIAYNAVSHRWLRVRESGGTVFWDTSPDGVTWTNRRSKTPAIPFVRLAPGFFANYSGTEPSPGTAIWDNVNFVPAIASQFFRMW